MARRLTDEISTIQRTRAEVLARSEIINSFSEATLSRYEQAGIDGVTVSGEFATADDDRVCPICEALEGTEYGTEEMRTSTFDFTPSDSEPDHLSGTYPVKPPVHPVCRCAILPLVG
jgi:SPP1 gp7 family putative phage head morphogenesis protein